MSPRENSHRCKAITKAGEPCRAAATAGGLCFFHANPNKAAECGRIGGRSKRRGANEDASPLPTLGCAEAVQYTVDRLVADIYTGKLDPRVAAGLAHLLSLQMRAIEATDLEGQIAYWKKRLVEVSPESEPMEKLREATKRFRKRIAVREAAKLAARAGERDGSGNEASRNSIGCS